MDPNLIKIRDTNIKLLKKGKPRRALHYAKDYLTNILTEYKRDQIDRELEEFKEHISNFIKAK